MMGPVLQTKAPETRRCCCSAELYVGRPRLQALEGKATRELRLVCPWCRAGRESGDEELLRVNNNNA